MDLGKLAAAKLWLVSPPPGSPGRGAAADRPRDLPYLSHALYALVPVPSADVPVMTCDQWWRVYVNEAWLASATVPDVARELAHAVWHLLSDHATRARSLSVDSSTATAWTTATDATVAATLDPDRLRPPRLPGAADLHLPPNRSAEEYYAMLSGLPTPRDPSDPADRDRLGPGDGCGSGADGLPRAHELGPDDDAGGVSTAAGREIRERVAVEYRGHHTRRGTDPGHLLRWVEDLLQPTTPWEPLLTGAVRRAVGWAAGRGEPTYTRPSRRAGSVPGVVLPGQHRPVPRLAVIVDTSGSVDDTLLARALGEVDAVLQALGVPGTEITLYSVDAAVHTVQRLRSARDATLAGAGGTDLRHGFTAVDAQRPRPDVVITFTDADTPWPATPPPGAAVIAAVLGRHGQPLPPTPDWATRVECRVDPPAPSPAGR
jgi:predicted metal-dependent peptidase